MTKQEQIEAKKLKPIEVDDFVAIKCDYTKIVTGYDGKGKNRKFITTTHQDTFSSQGTVLEDMGDKFLIKVSSVSVPLELSGKVDKNYIGREAVIIALKEFVFPTFLECGANPFCKEKRRVNFTNKDIQSLFWMNNRDYDSCNRVNFNPFVHDKDGNKIYYQRDFVWTLEQKQLLIDSIYNDIEIGKFLFRYNSWDRLQRVKKEVGQEYSWDIVDGKQRLGTIYSFTNNEFPDRYGNYWDDLSGHAKRRFKNYGNLSYGELPESATDEDVIDSFLTLNFTGTPMSQEHIEFVKSIKL